MSNEQNSTSPGTGPVAPATENPESVRQSTSALVDKHRKEDGGKKRGRPPKDAGKQPAPVAVKTPVVDPFVQLNLDLVKKSISALVSTADAVVCRRVFSRAVKLGADQGLAKEYVQMVGLTKDELGVICDCTAVIMSRSEWLIRHAPEAMLLCVAASYTVRAATVLARLSELEAKQKKDAEKKPS